MSTAKIIAGGLTQVQIDALKKKHGKLTVVTVEPIEKEGEDLHFWFKQPDSKTMSAVTKLSETDPYRSIQIYFTSCLIKGEKSYVDNPEVFSNVAPYLENLVADRKTSVKNF